MNQVELNEVLDEHERALAGEKGNKFADLYDQVLCGLSFKGRDLTNINLQRANLSFSDMSNCIIHQACLSGANMINVNLTDTNITDTDMRWAVFWPKDTDPTTASIDTATMESFKLTLGKQLALVTSGIYSQ